MRDETFTLTEDLVTLLRNSFVTEGLTGCEYGAAEIDPKRPYGNSDVATDIAELLAWAIPEGGLSEAQREDARTLHGLTPLALQVVLSTGSFRPGVYRRTEPYGSTWVLDA